METTEVESVMDLTGWRIRWDAEHLAFTFHALAERPEGAPYVSIDSCHFDFGSRDGGLPIMGPCPVALVFYDVNGDFICRLFGDDDAVVHVDKSA